jgi:hypothetical protein
MYSEKPKDARLPSIIIPVVTSLVAVDKLGVGVSLVCSILPGPFAIFFLSYGPGPLVTGEPGFLRGLRPFSIPGSGSQNPTFPQPPTWEFEGPSLLFPSGPF